MDEPLGAETGDDRVKAVPRPSRVALDLDGDRDLPFPVGDLPTVDGRERGDILVVKWEEVDATVGPRVGGDMPLELDMSPPVGSGDAKELRAHRRGSTTLGGWQVGTVGARDGRPGWG